VNLALGIPDELVEAIARRAAELVLEQLEERGARGPELLTVPEAAELLRCKPQRIYELISDGRLAGVMDGGRRLIRRVDVDAHLGLAEALPPALRRRRVA
jgi:excisionase family DNA binding protein